MASLYGGRRIWRKSGFNTCEKVDLTPEIKIFKNVATLLPGSTVHGIRDGTDKCVCVQHENKVCVHSLTCVHAAGDSKATSSFIARCIWGAPMEHGKAGASLEACKIQEF